MYKELLIECAELRGLGGKSAFKRAGLLVRAFNDNGFRAEVGDNDFLIAAKLDAYVEDLCLGFLELKKMLEFAPDEAQWATGQLRRLHAQMMAANAMNRLPKKPLLEAQPTTMSGGSLSYEESREAMQFEQNRISELDALRAENMRLKRENAELRKRLSKLRRLVEAEA